MNLGAGWLARTELPAAIYYDVLVPRVSAGTAEDPPGSIFPTRIEEYGWVASQLADAPKGGVVLDAGAGYNPEIHVLAYIVANMGFNVVAMDADARALTMPPHAMVQRVLGDASLLPYPRESFDDYLCISVIEHLMEAEKALLCHEAFKVLKPSGWALFTTDETEPAEVNEMLAAAGFHTGPLVPFGGEHLTPRVAWAAAQKP